MNAFSDNITFIISRWIWLQMGIATPAGKQSKSNNVQRKMTHKTPGRRDKPHRVSTNALPL
jgi:hypothetical protein